MRDPGKLLIVDGALTLAVAVYRLTNGYPQTERFGLCAQMRRAAVSVGSNIAEGCGRSGDREFLHFLRVARGSTTELAFQRALSVELGFGTPADHDSVKESIDHVQRMLNRLTQSVRQKLARTTGPDVKVRRPASS